MAKREGELSKERVQENCQGIQLGGREEGRREGGRKVEGREGGRGERGRNNKRFTPLLSVPQPSG